MLKKYSIFLVSLIIISACGGGGGGGGGSTNPTTPPVNNPDPVINTFSTSANTITQGESITLSWTSSNATSCSASGDWSDDINTTGSVTKVLDSVKTYTFTLTCNGASGTTPATDNVSVVVVEAPKINSFTFLQSKNINLDADITLDLSSNGLIYSATVSSTLVLNNLIATFDFTGNSVSVNNFEQESGVTQINFNEPVVYRVTNSLGKYREYQIELNNDIFPSITSFTFKAENNNELSQDLELDLDGNIFKGRVVENINISELTPSFSFTGKSVSINNILQESEITSNNYEDLVVYTVTNNYGDTNTYQIDLTKFTGLPIIYLTTDGAVEITSKEEYVEGDISIDGRRNFNSLDGLSMKIRGRGNSTWFTHPKKPFQMKLDEKSEFLGMPRDKKWLFLAEYSDKTMLRNTIAFELGYMSNLDWTPEGEFAEVYINDMYNGTYNITQKVEESDNRVALGDTGYLLELDQLEKTDPDDVFFDSNITSKFIINIKEPDLEFGSEEYNYIQTLIFEFEKLLSERSFGENGYKSYIDLDSFVDWYLISEITKNVDSQWYSSIYLNVIPGEKIKMGPLWDFDLAFGNTNYADTEFYEGWWIKDNPWYEILFQDPVFVEMVKARFTYFYDNKESIIQKIDTYAEQLKWAQEENDKKWGTLGIYVWPNPVFYDTYQEEIDHLKNWYLQRMDWLQQAFDEL